MSTSGNVIYVRDEDDDAIGFEEESGVDIENVWDDTKLVESYDKASYLMHQAVAKRIAMQTNKMSVPQEGAASGAIKKNKKPPKENDLIGEWQPVEKSSSQQWKPDMPCRAVCANYGKEYEARILAVLDDDNVVVQFLGYPDYSETVALSSLKPSLGRKECARQINQSIEESTGDHIEIHDSDSPANSSGYEEARRQIKKKKTQKRNSNSNHLPQLNNIDMNYVRRLGEDEVPFAPPPPLQLMREDPSMSENQVINSMVISWYMSGYYSGIYQGMKMAKSRNNRRTDND